MTAHIDRFEMNGETFELVEHFEFLGSRINRDGGCAEEICRKIGMARKAMTNLQKIMKDCDISRATKIRIVRAMVFPVAMYGCETWTIRKRERKRIDSFELWCWRRLLRIPWTARRTNRSVIDEIRPVISMET